MGLSDSCCGESSTISKLSAGTEVIGAKLNQDTAIHTENAADDNARDEQVLSRSIRRGKRQHPLGAQRAQRLEYCVENTGYLI
jgi:hypothetical protein